MKIERLDFTKLEELRKEVKERIKEDGYEAYVDLDELKDKLDDIKWDLMNQFNEIMHQQYAEHRKELEARTTYII